MSFQVHLPDVKKLASPFSVFALASASGKKKWKSEELFLSRYSGQGRYGSAARWPQARIASRLSGAFRR